jgi:hypothetical protein
MMSGVMSASDGDQQHAPVAADTQRRITHLRNPHTAGLLVTAIRGASTKKLLVRKSLKNRHPSMKWVSKFRDATRSSFCVAVAKQKMFA